MIETNTEHRSSMLLIDDDEILCSVLASALEKRGFDVAVAHDCEAALSAAADASPEYAVVDLKLPGSAGLSLIEKLMNGGTHMRIVVLTGYGSIATAMEATKLGVHAYLTKPVDADDIVLALRSDGGTFSAPEPKKLLSVRRLEWEYIHRVLSGNNGNISATARLLGMHRRTLQRKLNKHPVKA